MATKKAEPKTTETPVKKADRPLLVVFQDRPNAPWRSAIVRQWNADETLSLCVFPHGIQSVKYVDSVPHKDSEKAKQEDRPHQAVWDLPAQEKQLRAEVADLKRQVETLTELITK